MKLLVFKDLAGWPVDNFGIPTKLVPVEVNFEKDGHIGYARISRDGDCLYATLEFMEGFDGEGERMLSVLYPSLKIEVDNNSDFKGGPIVALGVCTNPNIDDRIERVGIQLGKNLETDEGEVFEVPSLNFTTKSPKVETIKYKEGTISLLNLATFLHNNCSHNIGDTNESIGYSYKQYGYLDALLDEVELAMYGTGDSSRAESLRLEGFTMTETEIRESLKTRIDRIITDIYEHA